MPDDAQLATVDGAPGDTADAVASPAACAVVPRTCTIDGRGLRKRFGDQLVLRDLTLQVDAGEIFGLIGPSGSGKSTAIQLCCGQLRPDGGQARVLGEDPLRFSTATRERLGYMPQGFVLFPDLTVEQNVAFAAGLYGLPAWRDRGRIRRTLELVELWEARKQAARTVSGGMRRRIALAATLVHDPAVLFVDEPTANLDPILRAKLWAHFRALCDAGRTLLVTTQYVDEAAYCDRVGLMHEGTLIAVGPPEALRRRAFGGDVVDIVVDRPAPQYLRAVGRLAGVRGTETRPDEPLRVVVDDAERALPALLDALAASGAAIRSVAQYHPTFDEVFIRLIEQHGGRDAGAAGARAADGAGGAGEAAR